MKIKNTWIVSIGLIAIAIVGIIYNQLPLTGVAVGGLVGWLAGERNGRIEEETKEPVTPG